MIKFEPGMTPQEVVDLLSAALSVEELAELAVVPAPPDRPQLVKVEGSDTPILTVPDSTDNGWLYRLSELLLPAKPDD